MSNPDYKTAAYVALEGISARAEVKEPEPIRKMDTALRDKWKRQIELNLQYFIGSAMFSLLKYDESWNYELECLVELIYINGVDDSRALLETHLRNQTMAQTRGMLSGLLRASNES